MCIRDSLYTVDVWASLESDPGPWCELDRGPRAFLREPSNAFSDLAYLWLALWLTSVTVESSGASLACSPVVGAVGVVTNLVHFGGSFFNHACRCHAGHVMDVFGMYSAVWYLTVLAGVPLLVHRSRAQRLVFGAVFTAGLPLFYSLSHYYYDSSQREPTENAVVTGMVMAISVCFWKTGISTATILKILLLMGFGKLCQELDIRRWYCNPTSWFQGHAAWHVATAVVMQVVIQELRLVTHLSASARRPPGREALV
eukprot:TRINITY_DN18360_c0_g1_i1.p1 TRINITY_DN18360_c0_g1~~TRINITY_DN18360_c0_g1_i1.p1  ORF type:complete len:256 (+),score=48.00 TRINITY_DN18360_c0_g1_i1:146-913(+)